MNHNPLWNLEKMTEQATAAPLPPLTGSRAEQGREIIRRCDERDSKLAQRAIDAERDGDEECCWMAMAVRAENKRVRDKIAADLAAMGEHENDGTHAPRKEKL